MNLESVCNKIMIHDIYQVISMKCVINMMFSVNVILDVHMQQRNKI